MFLGLSSLVDGKPRSRPQQLPTQGQGHRTLCAGESDRLERLGIGCGGVPFMAVHSGWSECTAVCVVTSREKRPGMHHSTSQNEKPLYQYTVDSG
jgi:hypothetical protein